MWAVAISYWLSLWRERVTCVHRWCQLPSFGIYICIFYLSYKAQKSLKISLHAKRLTCSLVIWIEWDEGGGLMIGPTHSSDPNVTYVHFINNPPTCMQKVQVESIILVGKGMDFVKWLRGGVIIGLTEPKLRKWPLLFFTYLHLSVTLEHACRRRRLKVSSLWATGWTLSFSKGINANWWKVQVIKT